MKITVNTQGNIEIKPQSNADIINETYYEYQGEDYDKIEGGYAS